MTFDPSAPYAEEHRRASESFRRLPPEQMRARLREAGVLGATPRLGDKVRLLTDMNRWRYAVVIGADAEGRVYAVHHDGDRLVPVALEAFSGGNRVQLVARAAPGEERAAALRAVRLIGATRDLADLDVAAPGPDGAELVPALRAVGLDAPEVELAEDPAWEETAARYRDARGTWVGR